MLISTSSDQTLRPGDSATEAEDAPCSSSWGSQQQQQQQQQLVNEPAGVTTSEPRTQHGWLQGMGSAAAAAAQQLHLATTVKPVYQRLHTESDADNVHDSAEPVTSSSPTAKLLQEQHAMQQQASQGHHQHSSSSSSSNSGVGSEEAVRFSMLQFLRFCGSG